MPAVLPADLVDPVGNLVAVGTQLLAAGDVGGLDFASAQAGLSRWWTAWEEPLRRAGGQPSVELWSELFEHSLDSRVDIVEDAADAPQR